MTIIFSYQRPKMLSKLLDEVEHPIVIDDGGEYDVSPFIDRCEYHRLLHGGKKGFWMNWRYAFDICKASDDDFFLFLPDDVYNVDLEAIKEIHESMEGAYAYNVLNVAGNYGWTPIPDKQIDEKTIQCGHVDCGYFCNREALEAIGFKQQWINPKRFQQKNISSGVGQSQSRAFYKKAVPMYYPVKSLAHHGDHESKMHKEERLINPLISK